MAGQLGSRSSRRDSIGPRCSRGALRSCPACPACPSLGRRGTPAPARPAAAPSVREGTRCRGRKSARHTASAHLGARLAVARRHLGRVQAIRQQALCIGEQLARKGHHLHAPARSSPAGCQGQPRHRQQLLPRTKLVPSPISCSCALAASTSSLAAGCSTSSSFMSVDASLVTKWRSRWLITILFMPASAAQPCLGALSRVLRQLCTGRRRAVGPHGRLQDGAQLLAGLYVLHDRLVQAHQVLVALLEHGLRARRSAGRSPRKHLAARLLRQGGG